MQDRDRPRSRHSGGKNPLAQPKVVSSRTLETLKPTLETQLPQSRETGSTDQHR